LKSSCHAAVFTALFLLFPLLRLLYAQLLFSMERFLSTLLSAQYSLPLRRVRLL
jgi:hypothetical protein